MQSAIRGLFLADTSHYYPEDRSISESLRLGTRLAAELTGAGRSDHDGRSARHRPRRHAAALGPAAGIDAEAAGGRAAAPASLPGWLYTGKAQLKRQVAQRVTLDIAKLPYNDELLGLDRAERSAGRSIVLCSASDEKFVSQVADHLGLFDEVIASDGVTNVSAERKAAILVERFGAKGFDYAGNSRDDVPVWAQARRAVLVVARARRAQRGRARRHDRARVRAGAGRPAQLGRARCACTSGSKNLLVFLPLLGVAPHRGGRAGPQRAARLLRVRAVRLVGLRAERPDGPRERPPSTRASACARSRRQRCRRRRGLWVCAALLLGGALDRLAGRPGVHGLARHLPLADPALHVPAEAQDPGRCPDARRPLHPAHPRRRRGGRHLARLLAARVLAVPVPEPRLREALFRARGAAARKAAMARRGATT